MCKYTQLKGSFAWKLKASEEMFTSTLTAEFVDACKTVEAHQQGKFINSLLLRVPSIFIHYI